MNYGAFVFQPGILTPSEVNEAARLATAMKAGGRKVHEEGRLSALKWFQVDLQPSLPGVRKVLDALGVDDPELLVFYYLEPEAKIHPHRDLSGAGLNNRIRFHVPIVTNDAVEFVVGGERVRMKPGDLWCLDTSYEHSVYNGGDASRVHLVIECDLTPALREKIPNNLSTKLHTAQFAVYSAYKFGQALVVNSWRDPDYFRGQMGMVKRYIGWRFLKIGKAS